MDYQLDKETIAGASKKALHLMSQRNIPLSPENYRLWFEYVIGYNKELEKDINKVIKEGGVFAEEINCQLYRKYFSKDRELKLVEEAQKEIQKILKEVIDGILYTQNFTSDYGNKLKGFTSQLEKVDNLEKVQKIVSDLMQVTIDVIKSGEELNDRLKETTNRSENLQKELEKAREEILIDPLTEIFNRKAFDRKMSSYLNDFEKEDKSFSLIMIDIDHFKHFNDKYGHQLGDQVLKFVGSFLGKELKGKDFAARYGGEEFAVLLLGTSLDNACTVTDKIRTDLSGVQLKYVKTGLFLGKVTISAGVAIARKGDSPESLVRRADSALYLAKQSGRNNVKSENNISSHSGPHHDTTSPSIEFLKQ